jgi:hypothetical protein
LRAAVPRHERGDEATLLVGLRVPLDPSAKRRTGASKASGTHSMDDHP